MPFVIGGKIYVPLSKSQSTQIKKRKERSHKGKKWPGKKSHTKKQKKEQVIKMKG